MARELDVSKASLEAALRTLEAEGCLKSGGPGRRKEIVFSRGSEGKGRVLRVGVVLSDPLRQININSQELMLGMMRRIENAGHICFSAERSMSELGYKLPRITRMLESAKADAWVAYSAPADVLKWLVGRSIPVMAIGGWYTGLAVGSSSADCDGAIRDSVRTLSQLGHRRIVTISPDSWRVPSLSKSGKAFMAAMEECGHQPTSYNLPAWEQTPAGLGKLLDSLFLITPPTALIFVDPATYVAALGFMGLKGIHVPRDVSIVSMTSGPVFSLLPHRPAHFKWPIEQHIRRVERWAKCLAKGGADLDQVTFSATFEPGETIGPVKERKPGK